MTPATFKVGVLGDSRVFDTYYATEDYVGRTYGYDQTFPHVLQRNLLLRRGGAYDCVHIPDHFRGRTIQNNILRLALVDPTCVVLCDGIWESLVSKKHVAEYFEQKGMPAVEYSDALATELFLANELTLSPLSYAARIGRIASWFLRRRRQVIWLTTPVPPKGYLDGLHYAGNYRPFDGWHDCLRAINLAASERVRRMGGTVIDMDLLMADFGGAQAALIDQWHFSAPFHARVAGELECVISDMEGLTSNCISRRVIVQGMQRGTPLGLLGSPDQRRAFKSTVSGGQFIAEADLDTQTALDPDIIWVALEQDLAKRESLVETLGRVTSTRPVVVFPEELASLDNPAVTDRSTFGSFQ